MIGEPLTDLSRASNASGSPIPGAKWYFYATGTSTPQPVYTTAALTTTHANPVLADAGGLFPPIYCVPSLRYRGVLTDASGTPIQDIDPVGSTLLATLGEPDGASLVNTLQAGSGATTISVRDKVNQFACVLDYIPRSEWAAIAGGTSTYDCTTAIRNASAAHRGLYFPVGTYLVVPPGGSDPFAGPAVVLSQRHNVHWRGYGATLKVKDGTGVTGYCMMLWSRLSNFLTIEGLTFDGNRAARTEPFDSRSHCITISGGTNIILRDVRVLNSTFDGVLLWPNNYAVLSQYPTDVLFDHCAVDNSYRNGVSVIGGFRIEFRGGSYNRSNGTLPMAGIDIEPDPPTTYSCDDIVLDGCGFYGNAREGLVVTGNVPPNGVRSKNVTVRNIRGRGNGSSLLSVSAVDNLILDGLELSDETVTPTSRAFVYVDAGGLDVTLRDLHFSDITEVPMTKACLLIENAAPRARYVERLVAKNVSCRTAVFLHETHADGIDIYNSTGNTDSAIHVVGTGSSLRNVTVNTAASQALSVPGTHSVIENVQITDAGTGIRMQGASNTYRNVTLRNTGTAAGYACYMDTPAGVGIENLRAYDSGGYWTNATAFAFAAGAASLAGARMRNIYPSPLMGAATWAPPSLSSLTSATKLVPVARADVGDAVMVRHSIPLAGLISAGEVVAANSVQVTLFNPTTGAVALASHTVSVEVVK